MEVGGPTGNRTRVHGFAVRYVTTPPSSLGEGASLGLGKPPSQVLVEVGRWQLGVERQAAIACSFHLCAQLIRSCGAGDWARLQACDGTCFH
jgi:hypothetical protein